MNITKHYIHNNKDQLIKINPRNISIPKVCFLMRCEKQDYTPEHNYLLYNSTDTKLLKKFIDTQPIKIILESIRM